MKNRQERRRRYMRGRIVFLTSIVVGLALAVLYRAFDLQVRQAPSLKEKAEAQYLRDLSRSRPSAAPSTTARAPSWP